MHLLFHNRRDDSVKTKSSDAVDPMRRLFEKLRALSGLILSAIRSILLLGAATRDEYITDQCAMPGFIRLCVPTPIPPKGWRAFHYGCGFSSRTAPERKQDEKHIHATLGTRSSLEPRQDRAQPSPIGRNMPSLWIGSLKTEQWYWVDPLPMQRGHL
jgi:hypothetical protein